MILYSIILFAVAAVFGLILLIAVFKNQPTPKPVVFFHGLIAASGLGVLAFDVIKSGQNKLSLFLFIAAALGGFTMLTVDLKKKPVPKAVALIHVTAAVAGLLLLILFVIR
ncbi:MAG: hypothetical protein J7604_17685 [Sporocytophaga sp.]|uniref:hypothetical protein n=1 Tax=Sporocytophaga sp. TaxID=2231183 RepID=UPI001B0A81AA|nr:hypothetical protein [Sporocytophaga sp.]MBO9702044.1 hypothetical protein [Sporocytophaga sp.]